MTPEDKATIHESIKSELITLERTIADLKEKTKPIAPDNAIGRISRMDAINNKSINDAALVNAQKTFAALEHALTKIETPEFGMCVSCGNEISKARIMHLPHANRCIACVKK